MHIVSILMCWPGPLSISTQSPDRSWQHLRGQDSADAPIPDSQTTGCPFLLEGASHHDQPRRRAPGAFLQDVQTVLAEDGEIDVLFRGEPAFSGTSGITTELASIDKYTGRSHCTMPRIATDPRACPSASSISVSTSYALP